MRSGYLLVSLLCVLPVAAKDTFSVSINTAPLIGHAARPFSIAFQFADGQGTGDGNNAAIISGFQFYGGHADGTPKLTGAASGDLTTGVTLTDRGRVNMFVQPFTPGSQLRFNVAITSNPEPGAFPDGLMIAILDRTGIPIPTTGGAPLDALMTFNLGPTSSSKTFASDPKRVPPGGGVPIAGISAPLAAPSCCVRQELIRVLDRLKSFRIAETRNETAVKLDDAIARLSDAIAPTRWKDDAHLSAAGDGVFQSTKQAVSRLDSVSQDKKATLGPGPLVDSIDAILEADRKLAVIAANDAMGASQADLRKPADAADNLDTAAAFRAKRDYDGAIEKYRQVWSAALEAVRK